MVGSLRGRASREKCRILAFPGDQKGGKWIRPSNCGRGRASRDSMVRKGMELGAVRKMLDEAKLSGLQKG